MLVARRSLRPVRILGQSAVAVNAPDDLLENILATIVVPAGSMGPNGELRIWTDWSYTNSANAKTLRGRFAGIGGTAFMSLAATTTVTARCVLSIYNVNDVASQKGMTANATIGLSTGAVNTSAVNTDTSDRDLVITGQKAVAGEVLTLERYLVELIRPD